MGGPVNDQLEEHRIKAWLSLLILVGGGGLLEIGDTELRMAVISIMSMVVSYWFGTSQSSKNKDDVIAQAAGYTPATAAPPVAKKVDIEAETVTVAAKQEE
jgi:hypothetical protein